jgi:hypothetical protein
MEIGRRTVRYLPGEVRWGWQGDFTIGTLSSNFVLRNLPSDSISIPYKKNCAPGEIIATRRGQGGFRRSYLFASAEEFAVNLWPEFDREISQRLIAETDGNTR